jgi:uncharacterized membrane protein HdeD (DUF308 family)
MWNNDLPVVSAEVSEFRATDTDRWNAVAAGILLLILGIAALVQFGLSAAAF